MSNSGYQGRAVRIYKHNSMVNGKIKNNYLLLDVPASTDTTILLTVNLILISI
jgi:hypothetical protein